jgi:methionyl-tRNA formyltransferase
MLKIAIITQEDAFVIPRNVEMLLKQNNIEIVAIYSLNAKGSFKNKYALFWKGFGFWQSVKMGICIVVSKLYNVCDVICHGYLPGNKSSIKAVALKYGVSYREIEQLITQKFYDELKSLDLDLIVSFSAPCIFSPELLKIPRNGCINLHCSLLPNYAGVLPSFWTLYHGERETGATVHFMDNKIDNGKILSQIKIDISDCQSMFHVIQRTKKIGGKLMVDVIEQIRNENIQPKPNDVSSGSYFTWPTVKQIREFRKRGGRLI